MSQYENPWLYDNKIFDSDLIGDYYGFVYLITGEQTGRRYIGRKYFWQKRKPRTGSKRRVTSESDWKKYYGSCPELKEDIKQFGKLNFTLLLSFFSAFIKGNCEVASAVAGATVEKL